MSTNIPDPKFYALHNAIEIVKELASSAGVNDARLILPETLQKLYEKIAELAEGVE